VSVGQDGRYAIQGRVLESATVDTLTQALRSAAQGSADNVIVISADAAATHQAVVNVMDAARRSGLNQITFATQQALGR
jgi:biopolymer transport protein ExbD